MCISNLFFFVLSNDKIIIELFFDYDSEIQINYNKIVR
jgi:hypothetical protein